MKNWFKQIFIPSGEKTTVVAYNSWVVRWNSIDGYGYSSGGFSFSHLPQSEIFPSEEDANKFAEQIREAFKLAKVTGKVTKVEVEANQSKMATMVQ